MPVRAQCFISIKSIKIIAMSSKITSTLFVIFAAVAAQKCPIQFDGRIPAHYTPESFDLSTSIYNPQFVYGQSALAATYKKERMSSYT